MTATPIQIQSIRRIVRDVPDIDPSLPLWARRTNPIIRRQLGPYWRVFPPEPGPILTWIAIHAAMLTLAAFVPLVYLPVMILMIVAASLFPLMLAFYVRALGHILYESSRSMTREYRNNTMNLLRSTPFSTYEIILSKIMAAVWRRMDMLTLAITFSLTLGLTITVGFYVTRVSPAEYGALPNLLAFLSLIASVVRLPLEMFMVASVGVMMGATIPIRNSALMGGAVLLFFYFLLLNLLRLLPVGPVGLVIVDAALPVVLPLVISAGAIVITARTLSGD